MYAKCLETKWETLGQSFASILASLELQPDYCTNVALQIPLISYVNLFI